MENQEFFCLPPVRKMAYTKIASVTSKSFGIAVIAPETNREVAYNLWIRDSPVPVSVTKRTHTQYDNQVSLELKCVENESTATIVDLAECTTVGTAEIRFPRALPAGSPVEVTLSLSADGLLSIHFRDLTTGAEVCTELRADSVSQVEQA